MTPLLAGLTCVFVRKAGSQVVIHNCAFYFDSNILKTAI